MPMMRFVCEPETGGAPQVQDISFGPSDRVDFARYTGGVPCFTRGVRIATMRGAVAVEDLHQGDLVLTRDNGFRPIVWIGHRPIERTELAARPDHLPIVIRKGALGGGLPLADLVLSPNHRVLVTDPALRADLGSAEAIVHARDLLGARGVRRAMAQRADYYHILFERHEVIVSNGSWTESFQPMACGLAAFHTPQREEVLDLFPELAYWRGLRAYGAARATIEPARPDLLRAVHGSLHA